MAQNRYAGGIPISELNGNTFHIREEQRAADRQNDLRDMIQYWNQLKQSAVGSPTLNDQDKETVR